MSLIVEKVDKRNAILQTTLKLISSNGFHAAPMSVIAKEAGVAAGTIYLYFENKEDLIIQLYKYVKEILSKNIIIPKENQPYKKKLNLIWVSVYDFFINNLDIYKFLEQYEDSPFITEEMTAEVSVFYEKMDLFFAQGIEAGFLRDLDIKIIKILFFQSISTMMRLHFLSFSTDTSVVVMQLFQTFWDGVKID